jgi:uncharacterized lipoprotein
MEQLARNMLFAVLLAAPPSLAGCAFTVDTIPLSYGRQPPVARVRDAERVNVVVNVNDARRDQTRVSCKKNGYGMEMAAIVTSTAVGPFVKTNVEWELKRRGFVVGADGLAITIDLHRFYNDFKMGFMSGDAVAEVTMDVTAHRTSGGVEGAPVFVGHFEGEGKNPNIQLCSGENAKVALDAAFDDAMKRMFADRRFLTALVGAAAPPPAPAAVTPPQGAPPVSAAPAGPSS